MMEFQTELFSMVWEEAAPLVRRHWEEVGGNERETYGEMDVDFSVYSRLEEIGFLHLTTARDQGRLAGYALYFVAPSFRYRGVVAADPDGFYLEPAYRKGLAGLQLLKEAEAALVGRGVAVLVGKCKVAHDCGVLFKRLGYQHQENVWTKKVARHG